MADSGTLIAIGGGRQPAPSGFGSGAWVVLFGAARAGVFEDVQPGDYGEVAQEIDPDVVRLLRFRVGFQRQPVGPSPLYRLRIKIGAVTVWEVKPLAGAFFVSNDVTINLRDWAGGGVQTLTIRVEAEA